MNWLEPWLEIDGKSVADLLAAELRRELCDAHVLYGIPVCAIGRREDCDDVLFQLLDGSNRYAVVHLTWSGHLERDPKWPTTHFYDSWERFETEKMKPDNETW